MATNAGIWIDHEKAFVVSIMGDEESVSFIESGVEKHIRLSGGSRSKTPFGPQEVAHERKADERRKHQLRRFYQDVIRVIDDAERILIFGPGEAKIELEKEIKKTKKPSFKIVGIEPADKMTERQITAKVRKYFLKSS